MGQHLIARFTPRGRETLASRIEIDIPAAVKMGLPHPAAGEDRPNGGAVALEVEIQSRTFPPCPQGLNRAPSIRLVTRQGDELSHAPAESAVLSAVGADGRRQKTET